ncbi:MAG: ABC transporter permease [Halioglobus sp.]
MTFLQYFSLVDTLARMDLRADAARKGLGYIWWVLEPLLFVLVFYVVFELIMQSGRGDFLGFLMCGKLTFIWFSKSVNQASNSIAANKGLIGRINVTKTLFPLAVIQEGLYRQAAVFVLLLCFLWVRGYPPGLAWGDLVPIMLVNYLMIVACSFVGACLVCVVRDFSMFMALAMTFLMFVSGVFWDARTLGDARTAELVLAFNPLAFIIDAYRQVLLHATAPDWIHLAQVAVGSALLLLVMVLIMRRSSQFLALRALS